MLSLSSATGDSAIGAHLLLNDSEPAVSANTTQLYVCRADV